MGKFKKYSRYKNLNNNYLPKIPEHWLFDKYKSVFIQRKQKNHDKNALLLSLFTHIGVRPRSQMEEKGNKAVTVIGYSIVKKEDLIVNKLLAWMGAIAKSNYNGVTSPDYDVYELINKDFNSNYFHYLCRSKYFIGECYRYGRGIMMMRHRTYPQQLKNIYIPIPPIEEQNKIVGFIEYKEKQINKLIKKQKKLIELLEEKKKRIITEAVTKGLDKSVPIKDSGIDYIGYVPKHWEVGKIKKYYKMITGFTPDTTQIGYYDDINGYNWMTISDLQGKYTPDSTNRKISEKFIKLKHPKQTPKGSLLYSFKLSVGQVAFAKENIYTNEAIASFLESDKCNLKFLFYSSLLIVNNANENIYSAKILNQNLIKNAFTVFPPLREQKIISDYLDKRCELIEKIINNKTSLIIKLEEYKKSLIALAVTGQIDVRDYEIPKTDDDVDLEEIENFSEDDTETISEVEYANN